MGMTVQRRKDTRTRRVFMHKVADIRGGVSVNVSELGGDFLHEGAVLSAPETASVMLSRPLFFQRRHQRQQPKSRSARNTTSRSETSSWRMRKVRLTP